jgi:hypothetical protein
MWLNAWRDAAASTLLESAEVDLPLFNQELEDTPAVVSTG